MRRQIVASCALLAMLFATAGCGSGTRPLPVNGVITWEDGKPVPGATAVFVPKEKEGKTAGGLSDKDGKFELTTSNTGDGALPGEYTIVVSKTKPLGEGGEPAEKDPGKLMKEVFAKKGGVIGKMPVAKSDIPGVYGNATSSPLKWKVESGNTNVKLTLKPA
jgi:hypothetical protein